jgi:hypothetical protein
VTLNVARRKLSTDEQRALVRRLRREFGWSFRQIEAATGIPDSTCQRWCDEETTDLEDLSRFSTAPDGAVENFPKFAKARGRDGKWRPAEQLGDDDRAALIERARALRDAGATLDEIANDLGVAIGMVSSRQPRQWGSRVGQGDQ